MKLNVKNILLFDDETFKKNNIDEEKYNLIRYCVDKERQICIKKFFFENDFLYKKSLELINSLNNMTYTKKNDVLHICSIQHRTMITLDNALQKQIFINNFVFFNNEQFIKFLSYLNISIDKIKKIISIVKEKKKNKDTILEIEDDDLNIKELCQIYECKYPTLIINKIFELYYKNPEIFNDLKKAGKSKLLIKK